MLSIMLLSFDTAHCAHNRGTMPWRLGESRVDDIESDFQRMMQENTHGDIG